MQLRCKATLLPRPAQCRKRIVPGIQIGDYSAAFCTLASGAVVAAERWHVVPVAGQDYHVHLLVHCVLRDPVDVPNGHALAHLRVGDVQVPSTGFVAELVQKLSLPRPMARGTPRSATDYTTVSRSHQEVSSLQKPLACRFSCVRRRSTCGARRCTRCLPSGRSSQRSPSARGGTFRLRQPLRRCARGSACSGCVGSACWQACEPALGWVPVVVVPDRRLVAR